MTELPPLPDPAYYRNELTISEAYTADQMREYAKKAVEAERQDAERYRYMRNTSRFLYRNGPGLYWYLPRGMKGTEGERLDSVLDDAIRYQRAQSELFNAQQAMREAVQQYDRPPD